MCSASVICARECRRSVQITLIMLAKILLERLSNWVASSRYRDKSISRYRVQAKVAVASIRCLVPKSRDATLTHEAVEALWLLVFMAAPERRREFEPSSRARSRSNFRREPMKVSISSALSAPLDAAG